jgi:hypothetical protein
VREFKKRYHIKKVAIIADIKDAVAKGVGMDVLPPASRPMGLKS